MARPSNPHGLPSHLSARMMRWATSVLDDFEATDSQRLLIVTAAEAWDRAAQSRRTIAADGAFVPDRYGTPKAHPALDVEHKARAQFAAIVRQLGLDTSDDEPDQSRDLRGQYARWRTS